MDKSRFPVLDTGETLILKASRGSARREILTDWLDARGAEGCQCFLLNTDGRTRGVWTGVNELLRKLLPQIQEECPDLLERHDYELTIILPELRDELVQIKLNLTDTAPGSEKVRRYAMDRAYRYLHGVIDLLESWSRHAGWSRLALALDGFDGASALVSRFFVELMRRKGERLDIVMLAAVSEGVEAIAERFAQHGPVSHMRLDLPADRDIVLDPSAHTRRARELEEEARGNLSRLDELVAPLIHHWTESDEPHERYKWEAMALGLYNHYGWYEDAVGYAGSIIDHLDEICGADGFFPNWRLTRWNLIGNVFNSLAALDLHDRARDVIERVAMAEIDDKEDRVKIAYILAMLHARFLPEKDLDRSEELISGALKDLEELDFEVERRAFLKTFLSNGLAYIRHKQGRPQEAIDLCREGFERLRKYLQGDRHMLHRTVLVYNIAQVHTATGNLDDALTGYTAAIEMDPNYSEYYNERGIVYLQMGRLDEAEADLLEAIELSPPYTEVWTNLGQVYRKQGRFEDAFRCFDRALDLKPDEPDCLVLRAQMHERLGRPEAALDDYDASLALSPEQPLVLANRAVLHYEGGRLELALKDLDVAVGLEPDNPGLYRNRAVALEDLGHPDRAVADLERYLKLLPQAPDRSDVQQRLSRLVAA